MERESLTDTVRPGTKVLSRYANTQDASASRRNLIIQPFLSGYESNSMALHVRAMTQAVEVYIRALCILIAMTVNRSDRCLEDRNSEPGANAMLAT